MSETLTVKLQHSDGEIRGADIETIVIVHGENEFRISVRHGRLEIRRGRSSAVADSIQPQTMTEAEWNILGERLFGPDLSLWRFRCPTCGNVMSITSARGMPVFGFDMEPGRG